MKDRIKKVFSNSDKDIDTILVANADYPNLDPNFTYLSGITSGVFERSVVIGYKDGNGYLLTSDLEEPIARKETKLKVYVFKSKDERKNQIKGLLSDVNRLGINGDSFTYRQWKALSELTNAEIIDISDAFSKSRSIKDREEIRRISNACEISSRAAKEFPSYIKSNMTEKQLSAKLVELQYKYGANNLAFSPSIVAFGKNSARPHHSPTDAKIKKNEFVLIDFGAEYQRYASDISRTFVFGRADKKMKEMYEIVHDAQVQATDMVRDGADGKDIDKFARDMIDRKFKGRFIHSLGHEVGLQVHDGSVLGPQTNFILKENMVVTVEPGIYIPEIGGVRIEDTVLVTKNKAKILTNSMKQLLEI